MTNTETVVRKFRKMVHILKNDGKSISHLSKIIIAELALHPERQSLSIF